MGKTPKRPSGREPIDELIDVVRSADPVAGASGIDSAYLSRVERAIDQTKRPALGRGIRSRRLAGGIGFLSAALVTFAIGAPAVGAIVWFQAQDLEQNRDPIFGVASPAPGEAAPPASTEDIPGSTWIDPSADDFDQWAVSALDLDLPVPAGMDSSALARSFSEKISSELNANEGGVVMQTASIQNAYAGVVRCLWIDEFFDDDGDPDAPQVLKASIDWMDWDPQNFDEGDFRIGQYKDAMRALDPVVIQESYQELRCKPRIRGLTAEQDDIP